MAPQLISESDDLDLVAWAKPHHLSAKESVIAWKTRKITYSTVFVSTVPADDIAAVLGAMVSLGRQVGELCVCVCVCVCRANACVT